MPARRCRGRPPGLPAIRLSPAGRRPADPLSMRFRRVAWRSRQVSVKEFGENQCRLDARQLDNYRREVGGEGLSSYPHPWLMPDFWQFPTVSMGLGPLMAIYQTRFMKYLQARDIAKTDDRKVWVFLGDGEMDEPESLARSAWRPGSAWATLCSSSTPIFSAWTDRCAATERSCRNWKASSWAPAGG
ncbi:protein of unknown function [Cupriavidus neocaledonicus]|uniref:Transketolase signature 1 domain-containing protein n=1 Tax=Cupriavidus neocaledonicus TaxID=1040979 RepID=A0A375H7C1_9BURK|nr:hypothetical protein CBM2605_A140085 [Cupriavidus neocaledonicus]SPD46778.1 protein of unknown function [Cupriavidus neocaledonicus]